MDFLPLSLFPERSLAESVITTVWVGIFIVCFFNLRLGWPFSGLVVPGYLVPLMIAKPASFAVVCVEGFLTYLLIRWLCDRFQFAGLWSSFFGRDRFFALIVGSLLVRLVLDGWFLPLLGEFINRQFEITFDYRNNLSSFGLIIVALVSNQFWKTGLLRGQIPFWTTTLLTFVIIRFVLMEYTNFNIGNLEYMYENISTSLVASPKAYIVLLTCGFVASRMNLLYGWEFNGILIPSLLASEWYHPMTILTTFVEAFVILGFGSLALRAPCFQRMTMEGARKMLLFFNVSYLYKLILGHVQQELAIGADLTAFYGYGYLVPTLIAVKIHDKKIPIRLTRATLQTSLAGAVIATGIGFLLTFLPQTSFRLEPEAEAAAAIPVGHEDGALGDVLRGDKILLYERRQDVHFSVPLPGEVDAFVRALRAIDRHTRTADPENLRVARLELESIGYEARVLEDRWLYLRERTNARGWGYYIIDLTKSDGLVVEVPAPIDEWAVFEAGSLLFRELGARALIVSGSSREENRDRTSDPLHSGRTLYSTAHRLLARDGVLQVRGYNDRSIASMRGVDTRDLPRDVTRSPQIETESALWVTDRIPHGLDLVVVRELLGAYTVEWGRTPYRNLQRDEAIGGFCELVLDREDRKRLLSLSIVRDLDSDSAAGRISSEREVELLSGDVRAWLLDRLSEIAPRGSDRYIPARVEELLFFDDEVLRPVLWLAEHLPEGPGSDGELRNELRIAASAASAFGYRISLFRHGPEGERYVLIHEDGDAVRRRFWGTFAIRLDSPKPFAVEVPRPGLERGSYEYGVDLFLRLSGRYIILAGSHPWANRNGLADLTRFESHRSFFQLLHQAAVRHEPSRPLLVIQVRTHGLQAVHEGSRDDVLLGLGDGCSRPECFSRLGSELHGALTDDGVPIRLVDGSASTAGYEAHGSLQAHYVSLHSAKEFCILWLSPFFAGSFVHLSDDSALATRFRALGLEVTDADLYEEVLAKLKRTSIAPVSIETADALIHAARTGDIAALDKVAVDHDVEGLRLIIDSGTRRPFLVVQASPDALPSVFSMSRYADERATLLSPENVDRESIEAFKRSRLRRLEFGDEP